MKKIADINSAEWCNIVFEGKNKKYGAYVLRQSSGKRHLTAFGIIVLFVGFIAVFPTILNKVKAPNHNTTAGVEGPYTLIEINKKPLNDVEEIIKPEMPEVPQEKFMAMDKFTAITIVDDNDVIEGNELKAMEDLTKSKKAIGLFQVDEGSYDADAVRKELDNARAIMGPAHKDATDKIFDVTSVEVMPQFPGGNNELYKYIAEHLKYPVMEQEIGTQGRVTVRFVVDKAGNINNVTILRGISQACDREAINVVKNMPKWIPGRQNGNPVQVYFTLPIVFKLKN